MPDNKLRGGWQDGRTGAGCWGKPVQCSALAGPCHNSKPSSVLINTSPLQLRGLFDDPFHYAGFENSPLHNFRFLTLQMHPGEDDKAAQMIP